MKENKEVSQGEDLVISEFLTRWKASDMILVGIGKEMELKELDILESSRLYRDKKPMIESLQSEEQKEWVKKSILFYEMESQNELVRKQLRYYNEIYRLLRGKPYFVVTTCNDGLIWYSDLDPAKVVTPCGNFMHGQCPDKCNPEIYDTTEALKAIVKKIQEFAETSDADEFSKEIEKMIPVCPACNMQLTFNQYKQRGYNENGYKRQWAEYMKWIQRTLNQKLLLLELGEGFDTPTVIRWPFEKVTYINQKAYLYRINEKFYQLTEEVHGKACAVKCNSRLFLDSVIGCTEAD